MDFDVILTTMQKFVEKYPQRFEFFAIEEEEGYTLELGDCTKHGNIWIQAHFPARNSEEEEANQWFAEQFPEWCKTFGIES